MTDAVAVNLREAVALAARNAAVGGGPFGAVLVTADGRRFEGVNRVTLDLDPTAHAEISAIREACRTLGNYSLEGSTLYSSCEPCPMCLASALWARVDAVYFAADRHAAAAAGFDDAAFYDYFEAGGGEVMSVAHVPLDGSEAPFDVWVSNLDRIEY